MWSGNWEVALTTKPRPCRPSRMLSKTVAYNVLVAPDWGVESKACVMTPQTRPGMRPEERDPVLVGIWSEEGSLGCCGSL